MQQYQKMLLDGSADAEAQFVAAPHQAVHGRRRGSCKLPSTTLEELRRAADQAEHHDQDHQTCAQPISLRRGHLRSCGLCRVVHRE